ncbi:MAG TPA: hypothetical protein V6C97_22425 [Oculatellaceae cyanobacterium]
MSKLFVFEGPDGVGKSSISQRVHDALLARDLKSNLLTFPGRAEGTLGHLVYRLHHNATEFGIASIDPSALQILHIAAHVDAIRQVISPLVLDGQIVILDRFWWSTLAYGVANGVNEDELWAMIEVELRAWPILPAAVFLVTREKPIRKELDEKKWLDVVQAYDRLAGRELSSYPVVRLPNEDKVEKAISQAEEFILSSMQVAQ